MKHISAPASVLLLLTFLAQAASFSSPQPSADRTAACETGLALYAGREGEEPEFLELYRPAGGALLYLGFRHTSDPLDPQLSLVRVELERFRPTVAFYEGRLAGVAESEQATVRRFGESGLLRQLARAKGIPIRSLEPAVEQEIAEVKRSFPTEQVLLAYLLQRVSLLRDREGLSPEQIRESVAGLLRRNALGLGAVAEDLTELEERFRQLWPGQRDWWDPPANWFSPFESSEATGSRFVNDVIRASFEVRDRHMYRLLVGAVLSGERVIAVVGRTHLSQQAPALRCALG